ncbi:alpha/beta fold hydrolase [Flindersiella endophytica]
MTYLSVRGARLWADIRGPRDAPALLYLHGGPGQGAYDFMHAQGDRLSQRLRLIGLDQRGVLHSDALPPGAELSENDLVDDFDALRDELGVERWAILGHSYGGRLALRYAAAHPGTVAAVVFENPPLDMMLSARNMMQLALPLLADAGLTDAIAEAEKLLADDAPLAGDRWQIRMNVLHQLGSRRMELYVKQPEILARFDDYLPSVTLDDDLQQRAVAFTKALQATESFSESLLPLLSRLTQPALLIKGVTDPVTSPVEIERFHADVRLGQVELFEESGHFAQFEEPERYARTVESFVLGALRSD